jgi:hypothetical protein
MLVQERLIYIHDSPATGNNHIRLHHNGDIYWASPIVYVHNFHSTCDVVCDHDDHAQCSDDFQVNDDPNRKFVHTDGKNRGVRGVFSHNRDNGALCLNRRLGTK